MTRARTVTHSTTLDGLPICVDAHVDALGEVTIEAVIVRVWVHPSGYDDWASSQSHCHDILSLLTDNWIEHLRDTIRAELDAGGFY